MPKLTATGSRFETFMEGWLIAPDAGCSTHGFAYLEILEVTGSDSLTVKGDLTTMLAGDERFWIFAPPSVDAQTGAIRGTYTGSTFKPAKCDSRYLWAQYRYMPPMAGYEVNPGTPGIYGRQPGTNAAGTYHAWNRQYDPGTGRWTTPDPAASPWGNLWEYVGSRPLALSDPSGLLWGWLGRNWIWSDEVQEANEAARTARKKRQDAQNEDSGCVLCIHSNSKTLLQDGVNPDPREGHVWLSFWCNDWGKKQTRSNLRTYGYWPTDTDEGCCGDGSGGLREDYHEKKGAQYGFGIGAYYHCIKLSKGQYTTFLDLINEDKNKKDLWTKTNNCAGNAHRVFTSVLSSRGTVLNRRNLDRATTPGDVSSNIKKWNGDKPQSDVNPFGGSDSWGGGYESPPEGHRNPKGQDSGSYDPIEWA